MKTVFASVFAYPTSCGVEITGFSLNGETIESDIRIEGFDAARKLTHMILDAVNECEKTGGLGHSFDRTLHYTIKK